MAKKNPVHLAKNGVFSLKKLHQVYLVKALLSVNDVSSNSSSNTSQLDNYVSSVESCNRTSAVYYNVAIRTELEGECITSYGSTAILSSSKRCVSSSQQVSRASNVLQLSTREDFLCACTSNTDTQQVRTASEVSDFDYRSCQGSGISDYDSFIIRCGAQVDGISAKTSGDFVECSSTNAQGISTSTQIDNRLRACSNTGYSNSVGLTATFDGQLWNCNSSVQSSGQCKGFSQCRCINSFQCNASGSYSQIKSLITSNGQSLQSSIYNVSSVRGNCYYRTSSAFDSQVFDSSNVNYCVTANVSQSQSGSVSSTGRTSETEGSTESSISDSDSSTQFHVRETSRCDSTSNGVQCSVTSRINQIDTSSCIDECCVDILDADQCWGNNTSTLSYNQSISTGTAIQHVAIVQVTISGTDSVVESSGFECWSSGVRRQGVGGVGQGEDQTASVAQQILNRGSRTSCNSDCVFSSLNRSSSVGDVSDNGNRCLVSRVSQQASFAGYNSSRVQVRVRSQGVCEVDTNVCFVGQSLLTNQSSSSFNSGQATGSLQSSYVDGQRALNESSNYGSFGFASSQTCGPVSDTSGVASRAQDVGVQSSYVGSVAQCADTGGENFVLSEASSNRSKSSAAVDLGSPEVQASLIRGTVEDSGVQRSNRLLCSDDSHLKLLKDLIQSFRLA